MKRRYKQIEYNQNPWKPDKGFFWVLFDMSNGGDGVKNYLWWFKTRKLAREHREWQLKQKFSARLSQPQKIYVK